jgi:malonate transporter MadM subunit
MQTLIDFLDKNGLIFSFLVVAIIMYVSKYLSKKLFSEKLPAVALAIILALVFAYWGGVISQGEKGLSDIKIFSGLKNMGGAMLRDFAIISTALGASISSIKKSGLLGILSLFIGILISFILGVILAYSFGFHDIKELCTLGAGACTYIVGPVTGTALGVKSDIIALSIGIGVVKAVFTAVATPFFARYMHLDNPQSAMVFGGLLGTNTGVMAGLGATDPKLVPYGALTATFYTGLGCLLCPSIFYLFLTWVMA